MTEILNPDIERDATAAPCSCGGYADRKDPTQEEIDKYQTCGRCYACCLAAFICRLCKKRFLVHLSAPEME